MAAMVERLFRRSGRWSTRPLVERFASTAVVFLVVAIAAGEAGAAPRTPTPSPSASPKPPTAPPGHGKAPSGKAGSPAPAKASSGKPAHHQSRTAKHPPPDKKRPHVVFDQAWASTPAAKAAALDRDACFDELRARKIAFTLVDTARGVLAPVRLPADVGGIVYRTELPAAERSHAPWDVFDCRVVVALDNWSPKLLAWGFSEVILFSAWRPPPKTWPEGQQATRHPGALAVDVKKLVRGTDPTTNAPRSDIVVERDWAPHIGAPVCGDAAPPANPDTAEGREVRAIACEIEDARLFSVMLTPHYDRAHHNHLHLEITPGVTWRLLR